MGVTLPIYLDNHATTKPDPEVLQAMLPFLHEHYGNASSSQHEFGWVADAAVRIARDQVARLIGAAPEEIIFTSGATESINLALKGVATGARRRGRIVTVATEHRAVLDTCRALGKAGHEVVLLPVDPEGLVSLGEIERAITSETILVTVMVANNEVGTIAPVSEIGALCRSHGVLFHTDASQAAGKIPLDVRAMNIDLLSLSAHKMHGPKGVGALFARQSPPISITPQIDGGGHERGLRSGTLNVPGVVGFGKAAELARSRMEEDAVRMRMLRDQLVAGIENGVDGVRLNGHPSLRLPNNANLCFTGIMADKLLMEMREIALSTGSACTSASPEPSHVLAALGISRQEVLSSVRFGLSRLTTDEEIQYVVKKVVESVRALRARLLSGVVLQEQ